MDKFTHFMVGLAFAVGAASMAYSFEGLRANPRDLNHTLMRPPDTACDREARNCRQSPGENKSPLDQIVPWFVPGMGPFSITVDSDSQALMSLIEKIHLDILDTKTGSMVCRISADGNGHTLLQNILPVFWRNPKSENSKLAMKLCSAEKFGLPASSELKRTFVFFSHAQRYGPFYESWTRATGQSYFNIDLRRLNLAKLYELFIHEYLIQTDPLERFVADGKLRTNVPEEDYCKAEAALKNPFVRYALTAVRVFPFERLIKQELGFTPPPTEIMSCGDRVRQISQSFGPAQEFMTYAVLDLPVHHSRHQPRCPQISQSSYWQRRAEDIQTLETIQVKKGDEVFSLCQVLTQPHLASWQQAILDRGPRPRIGEPSIQNQVPNAAAVRQSSLKQGISDLLISPDPKERPPTSAPNDPNKKAPRSLEQLLEND